MTDLTEERLLDKTVHYSKKITSSHQKQNVQFCIEQRNEKSCSLVTVRIRMKSKKFYFSNLNL